VEEDLILGRYGGNEVRGRGGRPHYSAEVGKMRYEHRWEDLILERYGGNEVRAQVGRPHFGEIWRE
jgi:hypothetical protein